MAPLATPTNLHPSSSANGLNVWHQEVITKRTRADTLMTFKLTSECYGSTGISTPTCILGNSFTTWFFHMKNPGSHRDPLISIWRGSMGSLSSYSLLTVLLRDPWSILKDAENSLLNLMTPSCLIKGIFTLVFLIQSSNSRYYYESCFQF